MKMCLLTENVPIVLNGNVSIDKKNVLIKWKCFYWLKSFILNEMMSIEGL